MKLGVLLVLAWISDTLWRAVAVIATRPAIFRWLVQRAMRTPYTHITSADGTSVYMARYWLFNPYPGRDSYKRRGWREWMPSVRIHHIRRADQDRHLHDHPWNARTIVCRGWYYETRGESSLHCRDVGYTGRLLFGEYHRIVAVPSEGVWTIFITWRYQGTWGFLVDGHKVPWRDYLGVE